MVYTIPKKKNNKYIKNKYPLTTAKGYGSDIRDELLLVTHPSIPHCIKIICTEKHLLTILDVLHNYPLITRLAHINHCPNSLQH